MTERKSRFGDRSALPADPALQVLQLRPRGVATDPAAQPSTASDSKVRQGYVEAANTSPTLEMSGLITAMRMFETNQKVMTMQSDRMSRVISDLSGTS